MPEINPIGLVSPLLFVAVVTELLYSSTTDTSNPLKSVIWDPTGGFTATVIDVDVNAWADPARSRIVIIMKLMK